MSEATPTDLENLRIGQQIRDLRKAKGVTLENMARQIGRSVGYVSQVERGKSALPIRVLQAISDVLDVPISWFFHSDRKTPLDELDYVVRSDARRSLNFSGTGISEQLLTAKLSNQIQMVLTEFAPGAGTQEPRQRKGEESGFIQAGQLELGVGDRVFTLEAGDSFSLSDDEPHWARNPSETEPTTVLWVISGGHY